jgi:DNA N-6-adenine-methyltransferase (Dam)
VRQLKPLFSSQSWEWPTPREFYRELDREFGFDFDPCPIGGTEDARSPLFVSWSGKRVFCNPPYGPEIPKFLVRAPEAKLAVFLLPARTDTRWFHELVLPRASEIRFIRGRLRFGEAKHTAPFPSMVVVYRRPEELKP